MLVSHLKATSCSLPCYLTILPGQTPSRQAEAILASVGAWGGGAYQEGDVWNQEYALWIGDPSLAALPRGAHSVPGKFEIQEVFALAIRNQTVVRLSTEVRTWALIAKYRDYWSRYQVPAILAQYGLPNMVAAASSTRYFDIALVYETLGIVVEFTAAVEGESACLNGATDLAVLRLTLTDRSSGLSIYGPLAPSVEDRRYWSSVDQILDVDGPGFYARVLSDPDACFPIADGS